MLAFNFLTKKRSSPSGHGITMMLDKGLGLNALQDLLDVSGDYFELAKFGWGTSALHNRDLIQRKIDAYQSRGLIPYPGGTLLEVAYLQDKITDFLDEAKNLGFGAIEISDGTITIPPNDREELINEVKSRGFLVITEVGKKDPQLDHQIDLEKRIDLVNQDIDNGADWVLIEAREGGQDIGIFDKMGKVKEDEVQNLMDHTKPEKLIWEAPQKNQQVYFILNFGPNVNLGNISADEITPLETIRQGLRGDTLGKVKL